MRFTFPYSNDIGELLNNFNINGGLRQYLCEIIPKGVDRVCLSNLRFLPSLPETFSGRLQQHRIVKGSKQLEYERKVLIWHCIQFGENSFSVNR
jgi:hypothetical protein